MRQSETPVADLAPERSAPGLSRRAIAWLFSQRHFHFKLLSGTAAGIVVIALLAGIFLYVTIRNHHQDTLRAHTIDVIRFSSVIENDIATLETDHRGFLLTGDQSYVTPFNRRRDMIRRRLENLTALILDRPAQRKRIMKVQEVVQKWIDTIAQPQIQARVSKAPENSTSARPTLTVATTTSAGLGNALLDQARDILHSLQDEEQITLNQRMVEQEWASQSTQILDFLPKLERSVLEMEKEKRGYLLTNETSFAEAYKRAITDFYTYNGYLSILVANAPSQAQLLAEIRSNVESWINNSAVAGIEAKRTTKNLARTSVGDASDELMGNIRQMLDTFGRNELGVYETRIAAATRERIIKTSALATLAILAVALLIVSNSYSFVLLRRQLSKLDGVETHIRSIIENILDGMITIDESGMIC